jgi:hypothetical protein
VPDNVTFALNVVAPVTVPPVRNMHDDNPVAMPAISVSSFEMAIGGDAASVAQL